MLNNGKRTYEKPVTIDDTTEGAGHARPLRRGWTTGACATAATRAAFEALVTGTCPDPVSIRLPNGTRTTFVIATFQVQDGAATAGVVKDAGDDPDVTHGALVKATVRRGGLGSGLLFRAGEGVGMVTRPGLPIPPGEPAINPVPRDMMRWAIDEVAEQFGATPDVVIEIAIPGGEALAAKTLNGRLGIIGGLSILGTTGVVIPFSCSAWIHSIHRGIDVARASGLEHIAGATGSTSESAVRALYALSDTALIEMGDFVGAMLKYIRRHPVARVTVAGGFAKMTKLGQGLLDLHSRSGTVDRNWLGALLRAGNAPADLVAISASANTAQQILEEAQSRAFPLADLVAGAAWQTAGTVLAGKDIAFDIVIFDRNGRLAGRSGP